MSGGLYNVLCGYSKACFFVLPMLGHREDWFPRFRDAFMRKAADGTRELAIFTRVGSLNQNSGYGEEKLYEEPWYLRFEDCDEDPTYGTYVFKCPEKWEKDFDRILEGKAREMSDEFAALLREFWPYMGGGAVYSLKAMKGGAE